MDYIIWAAVIIVALIVEVSTTQLVSIWFAGGGLAGLTAAFCHAEIWLQIVIAVAVTLILLLITRPLTKRMMKSKVQPTNADRAIGQTGTVTDPIDNLKEQGRVSVLGNDWRAVSIDGSKIEKGAHVTVEKIEGVKLIVSLKK